MAAAVAFPPKLFDARSPPRFKAYESWDILAATFRDFLSQRSEVSTMKLN